MESSESGSMQSSSGGDEHEPYSQFSGYTVPNDAALLPPRPPQLSQPLSSYTHLSSIQPPPDTWPHHLRSDDLAPSSSAHPHQRGSTRTANTVIGVKTAKKRSRASRRVPTTVLTTDTSNFRAMVQEFTGIPSYVASPFHRASRVDNVGATPSPLMTANSLPSYLLRSLPHKIQQPSSLFQSQLPFSAVDATTTTTKMAGASTGGSSRLGYVDLLERVNHAEHPEDVFLANTSIKIPINNNADTSSNHKLTVLDELRLINAAKLSSAQQTTSSGRNDNQDEEDRSFMKPYNGSYNVS